MAMSGGGKFCAKIIGFGIFLRILTGIDTTSC